MTNFLQDFHQTCTMMRPDPEDGQQSSHSVFNTRQLGDDVTLPGAWTTDVNTEEMLAS
jgi:hypothetical protein